jgi:hypothetical protein
MGGDLGVALAAYYRAELYRESTRKKGMLARREKQGRREEESPKHVEQYTHCLEEEGGSDS